MAVFAIPHLDHLKEKKLNSCMHLNLNAAVAERRGPGTENTSTPYIRSKLSGSATVRRAFCIDHSCYSLLRQHPTNPFSGFLDPLHCDDDTDAASTQR